MFKEPEKIKDEIVAWIREYFEKNGKGCWAVVGISGGKDSSVAAALCREALGKDRVMGVLMPSGVQSDISCSRQLVEHLGIPHMEINVGAAVDALLGTIAKNEDLRALTGSDQLPTETRVNLPARIRMTTLYAVAQSLPGGGRVTNTCNRSEDYVGYSTKYGDAAGDFSPMSHLCVQEVRQIGRVLGLPQNLIEKVPTDGLSGKSDEEKLGFTYETLDRYILEGVCEDEEVRRRIDHLHAINLHKLQLMPSFQPAAE
ncbi:MAG: NAD(+) synthase [Anaerovoracaceae bacterium]|jgi:NAD+ synthase